MLRKKDKKILFSSSISRVLSPTTLLIVVVFVSAFVVGSLGARTVFANPVPAALTQFAADPPAATEPVAIKNDCNGENIRGGIQDKNDPNYCGILNYLVLFIQVLSAAVGIIVVGVLIVSGIQYSASGDNPNMVSAAKQRIINAIIALVVYVFMFAFLQYIVPGGVV